MSSDHAGPVLSPHSPSEQGWVPSRSLRRSDVPSDALRHLTKVRVTSHERFCLLRPCRAGIVPSLPLRADIHKRSISPQLPSGKDSVSVAHTVQLSFPQASSEPLRKSNVSSHAFRAELYSPQIPGGPCSLRCPHNRACSPQTLSAHPLRGELCPLRHPQKVHVPSCANREGLGLLRAHGAGLVTSLTLSRAGSPWTLTEGKCLFTRPQSRLCSLRSLRLRGQAQHTL